MISIKLFEEVFASDLLDAMRRETVARHAIIYLKLVPQLIARFSDERR